MQRGVNYWKTYAPVVGWAAVRLLLFVASVNKIPTRSIDFVLAFPQAGTSLYGTTGRFQSRKCSFEERLCFEGSENLYGLKNASLNWFEKLKQGLEERNFRQSNIDSCIFIRDNCVILVYVDDCIIISQDMKVIDRFIKSMQDGKEKFILTDDVDLARFLRFEIEYKKDGSIIMTQSHLI